MTSPNNATTTTTAISDYFPLLAWAGLGISFTQNSADPSTDFWILLIQAALLVLFAGWSVTRALEYGKGRESVGLVLGVLLISMGLLAFWHSSWARLAVLVLVVAYVIYSRKLNRRPWEEPTALQ
ncbi:Ca2+/Na+ antiporter [Arcanobacterium wilhelmae]|uniref:Ca2+/Na+ antiporter n=1 Tax=Arcanobacterium wilhelmae TaxID=1803177 RepID=A0ABT9NAZ9_9ACTO|nr:hypothetical protein [Arcanobacterium wilhelmae]MDP9800888.1 Ca2+/Na+ antiporter [Arcanobacterium wilhelmae]WFN90255.1 hypothetical protein P8A24_08740 [Arcanobacterium wilhelmae]